MRARSRLNSEKESIESGEKKQKLKPALISHQDTEGRLVKIGKMSTRVVVPEDSDQKGSRPVSPPIKTSSQSMRKTLKNQDQNESRLSESMKSPVHTSRVRSSREEPSICNIREKK